MRTQITEAGSVFEISDSGKSYFKGRIVQSGLEGNWVFYASVFQVKVGLFKKIPCVESVSAETIALIDKWIKARSR